MFHKISNFIILRSIFCDFKHFNYWGRIHRTLEDRGDKIYYGEHQSALAIENSVSKIYNTALKELGDETPDFMVAVTDLTNKSCIKLNEKLTFPSDIYSQSIGSIMNVPRSGRFPLNLSYRYVTNFDGPNDGLVGEDSFK